MDNYYIVNNETGKLELHFDKDTYAALEPSAKESIKRAFVWGHKSGCWISRCKWPNLYSAKKVAAALHLEDGGEVGDRPSFAEQMERKTERAQERAAAYERRADSAQNHARELQKPINDMHGDIAFFTQPNINSSAGRAFTRRRDLMFAAFERGFEEFNKSDYWRERAATAHKTAAAASLCDKGFVQRRIEERLTSIRQINRWIERYTAALEKAKTDGRKAQLQAQLDTYADMLEAKLDELGFYQDVMDALGGVQFSRANLHKGDLVKLVHRGFNYGAVRVINCGSKNFTFEFMQSNMRGTIGKASYAEIDSLISPHEPAPCEPAPHEPAPREPAPHDAAQSTPPEPVQSTPPEPEQPETAPAVEIIPGINYVCIDGVPHADMTPELFAQLYAADETELSPGEKLERALKRATVAALAHAEDEDGGACNFDAPALDYKAAGLSKVRAQSIISRVGLRSFQAHNTLEISGFQRGCGFRYSHMAEAFRNSLCKDGYKAVVLLQMD